MSHLMDLSKDDLICLSLALRKYLQSFERERVQDAPADSSIGIAKSLYNRIYNLRAGNAETFAIHRVPELDYQVLQEGRL